MPTNNSTDFAPGSIGIIGFGAFGRLLARHLRPHFRDLLAYDPSLLPDPPVEVEGALLTTLSKVASCSVLVFATPVNQLETAIHAAVPYLQPGSLVVDVGSVKVVPAEIMRRILPEDIAIVATHPLFGPQSARAGIAGLKIAVCPIRGGRSLRVAAFLRRVLHLKVVLTTPEAHDREAAMVQGLTHLIARVLVQMEPLPTRMTTRSFELLMEGVGMVRDDAPEVLDAIERSNPFSREVRRQFFDLASALDIEFTHTDHDVLDGNTELAPTRRTSLKTSPKDSGHGAKADVCDV